MVAAQIALTLEAFLPAKAVCRARSVSEWMVSINFQVDTSRMATSGGDMGGTDPQRRRWYSQGRGTLVVLVVLRVVSLGDNRFALQRTPGARLD